MKLAVRKLQDNSGYVGIFQKNEEPTLADDVVVLGPTVVECMKELTKILETKSL